MAKQNLQSQSGDRRRKGRRKGEVRKKEEGRAGRKKHSQSIGKEKLQCALWAHQKRSAIKSMLRALVLLRCLALTSSTDII